jgi:hypothetical protein
MPTPSQLGKGITDTSSSTEQEHAAYGINLLAKADPMILAFLLSVSGSNDKLYVKLLTFQAFAGNALHLITG